LINADNRHADLLAERAAASPAGSVKRFGVSETCDHRLIDWTPDEDGSKITASIDGVPHTYRLALSGHHQALNSVGVLAVVHHLGADVAAAAHALAELEPLMGRGRRHKLALDGGSATIHDESYNASPAAVRAALEVLAAASPGLGGRRIVVLGDMLELGAVEVAEHTGLAGDLISAQVDLMFAVGPLMNRLYGELPPSRRGGAAGDARAIAMLLSDVVRPGDVVLIKGSRRIGLEMVVEALLDHARPTRVAKRG